MKYKINRIKASQLIFSFLTVFLSIGVPIVNYIMFKASLTEGVEAGNLEGKYDVLIITIIIVGLLISFCSYMYFRCPKYSVKKGLIALTHSVLDLVFLILFSQFTILNIFSKSDWVSCSGYSISGISLNLSGSFIILIIVSSLFVLKNIYDLFDFKINESILMIKRVIHG